MTITRRRSAQGKPRRACARGFPRTRRQQLDEAHASPGSTTTARSRSSYRPVHMLHADRTRFISSRRRRASTDASRASDMAEFTLPANSKVGAGQDLSRRRPAPNGSGTSRSIAGIPTTAPNPRLDTYRDRSRCLRPDGPRRADQDQERDRHHADLPPLLPRRHLRLLRDEYRRHQHPGLPEADRRGEGRRQDLSAAAYAGGQGSGARSRPHPYAQYWHRSSRG